MEEDRLYRQFQEQRDKEVQKVNHGLQEEWEIELEKLTSKFERELGKRCLLYTSPSPRDVEESRMPSSA